MAKATRVHSTPRKTASKKRSEKAAPREGLALISAANLRKTATPP